MYKDGVVQLAGWPKGIADSPYIGFASMLGCEVFETPGVLKIAARTVKNTAIATIDGLPIKKLTDVYGAEWILTNAGKLYRDNLLIKSSIGGAWDMVSWRDYIIVRHGLGTGVLSAWGPLSSGAQAWVPNFASGMDSSYYGKLLAGQDDIVYIGNGNKVASLAQAAGQTFNPSSGATFGFNLAALTLPLNEYVVTFEEIGKNLVVGTQGGSNWADRTNFTVAKLYPWDRSSPSFNLPIKFNECGIQAMIAKNNRLYVVAGTRGNVYETDLSTFALIRTIPWNTNRIYNTSMMMYPNAIGFSQRGNLLVGTSTAIDTYGSTPSNSKHGLYEISMSRGYPAILKNIASTGNVGASQPLYIGMVWTGAGDDISFGWQDGSAYGLDDTDFHVYANYAAYLESEIMYIALKNAKKGFQHIEFKLGRPLIAGQGIKLYGRKNLSATYKLLGTFDFAALGAVISHHASAIFSDLEIAQFMLALTQPTTAPVGSNLELLDFRIW